MIRNTMLLLKTNREFRKGQKRWEIPSPDMSCKTNWENLGGDKRRERMPAHNMFCQPSRNPCAGNHFN